ncbi:DUF2752 domain-containing protein [Pedobacter frigidisoli]
MRLINQDFLKAFRIVWIITGLLCLFIIIKSVLISPIHLRYIPLCPSKAVNSECILCGMTRAFINIGEMNLKAAYTLNKGSVLLFSLILLNALYAIIYIIKISYSNKIKTKQI